MSPIYFAIDQKCAFKTIKYKKKTKYCFPIYTLKNKNNLKQIRFKKQILMIYEVNLTQRIANGLITLT